MGNMEQAVPLRRIFEMSWKYSKKSSKNRPRREELKKSQNIRRKEERKEKEESIRRNSKRKKV